MRTACGIAIVLVVVAFGAWGAAASRPASLIMNGSFETAGAFGEVGAPREWEGLAMGTIPVVVQDCTVAYEGRCSMKVMSDRPVLTNFIQTITLEPNQPYVLTGWIKTDKLEVKENADIYGTLVVMPEPPIDENQVVKGPSFNGTTDWTQVRLDFKSSEDGKTNILCSYCGQSTATGIVWFDDLRIVPASQAPATGTAPAAGRSASRPASRPAASQPDKAS